MKGLIQFDDVVDRRSLEDVADVVIIGSGAAGATAARVLTEAGLEVVILEEGPFVPTAELRSDMFTAFKYIWRDMGMQVALGRSFAPVLQGSCVGGTTVINGAIIHRLPEVVHRAWQNEHGLGEPFTWSAFGRVFDQLDRELSVDVAPEDVLGKSAQLLRAGVEAMGLKGNKIRRSVKGCRGSGHCNQGCPTAQKQSMNTSFIPRALAGGARLYATCRADRVLSRHGRAVGVTGRFVDRRTGRRGPRFRVHARKAVVVAASAIQTPVILRASGLGAPLLGRKLQAHPGAGVVGVFDTAVDLWFGATQAYETMHFWDDGMKLETVGMPLDLAASRLPGVGEALMRNLAAFGHLAIWGVEVRAKTEGRVRRGPFGGARIHYSLDEADVRALKRGIVRLAELMFAAGAREVLPGIHGLPDRISNMDAMKKIFDLPDSPRILHFIAAHLFGTARMGKDPRASVVGPELESHEMPGLYVADSSVFPSNIGVNPQHSICAVSWLGAERLAERLRR